VRVKLLYKQDDSGVRKGSVVTRQRWSGILESLGHEIVFEDSQTDLAIAFHAYKSSEIVFDFKQACPNIPVFICMTGTDLYKLSQEKAERTLELCDKIIVLQDKARGLIPEIYREKVVVIYQSTDVVNDVRLDESEEYFDVLVVGHLREVKDSMRTAIASRSLPNSSRVRVLQLGAVLEPEYNLLIEEELESNERYLYLGEVSKEEVCNYMSSSSLMVLSSRTEGCPSVISEAVAFDLPIICSKIDCTTSLFGEDYPGFFEYGDTDALARLILKAERDEEFLDSLIGYSAPLRDKLSRENEIEAWIELLSPFAC